MALSDACYFGFQGSEASTVTTVVNQDAPESQTEPTAFEREEVIKLMQDLKVNFHQRYKTLNFMYEAESNPGTVGIAWRR